ncbi:hypothetical protein QVD17_40077 [Tagetes erecta]|uniref:Uncharacterized protein n=1 Tax=Tagetes erecta TaxID=13708 RepID=A0AAD8NGS1_TARER|nr:hypothetical protein QVD17_40077 [Tagetes erecta]
MKGDNTLISSSNRKAKMINSQTKKLNHQQQKSIKRNLNHVFLPITEVDTVLNSSASISEAVDADLLSLDIGNTNLDSESLIFDEDQSCIESYIASLNQHISPSSVTDGSVAETTTPLSSVTTVETALLPSSSRTADVAAFSVDLVTNSANSVNVESLVKHLRGSMIQVLNPTDIEPQYKKLSDALVKIVTQELCNLHEERSLLVEQFSMKLKFLLLSCFLGLLLVSLVFFIISDAQNTYNGPPPT